MRTTYSMNPGWKFHRGAICERNFSAIHAKCFSAPEWMKTGNHGLSKAGFPDDGWQDVDLPHDFVIEGEFSSEANPVHGSLPVDAGWYRKTFHLPACEAASARVHLEFDGIYRDSEIWLNGHFIGKHLSGYTSFSFDVTEVADFGELNCLAVRCDAEGFELWSYEGGGIYRDVRLVITSGVHIPYSGTQIISRIPHEPHPAKAEIEMRTLVENRTFEPVESRIEFQIIAPDSAKPVLTKEVSWRIAAGETVETAASVQLPGPLLWTNAHPHLYKLRVTVRAGGVELDTVETRFGIRSVRFDPNTGFSINGQRMKLKGICEHQDHAGVGTAIPKALYRWRLERLIEMGANALRTAHNPPSPALLDLCDELGIFVMDEHRLPGTSPEMLSQLESLIRRDRNHPCVILWSLGNEEMGIQENPTGPRILRVMQELAHKLDPTRLCTYATNNDFNRIAENFAANDFRVDVFGANYTMREGLDGRLTARAERYDEFHAKFPDWPLIGSETGGSSSTRGLYGIEYYKGRPHLPSGDVGPVELNPLREGTSTAYSETLTPWGRSIEDTWRDCATRDFLAGTFLWTGFDYRGETFPFQWPAVITRYGLMDLCGFPKDAWFYYQSQWTTHPVLHLLPHWNQEGKKEGGPVDVWGYTNCTRVDLFLNGTAFGSRLTPPFGKVQWLVDYAPGELEAVGFDVGGREIIRTAMRTTGKPQALRLQADRTTFCADGEDVAVVRVEVIDQEGRVVPTAENLVRFEISGPARIIGVGNGNPISHESDHASQRRVYCGLAQVLLVTLPSSGRITLSAYSDGLTKALLAFESRALQIPPRIIGAAVAEGRTEQRKGNNPVDGAL